MITAETTTPILFATSVWKAPQTKLWGVLFFGVAVMAAWLYMPLAGKATVADFLVVELTMGVLGLGFLWILLRKMPCVIVSGAVDDTGVHGRGFFRRKVSVAWDDVREAHWGFDENRRVAGLGLKTRSGRWYGLNSNSADVAPQVAAAADHLTRRGVPVLDTPGSL